MQATAATFEVLPRAESKGRTLLDANPARIFMALKNSVILLEDQGRLYALLTSHFITHNYSVSNFYRRAVANALGISRDAVLCFSSHNHCVVKLNFPTNMTVPYRAALIRPIRNWLKWALSFHAENRLHEAPQGTSLHIAALRLGDVGIVGMPCEPLLELGRQIKRGSPLPFTVPCGYMNDTNIGYVPDAANCEDHDYVSAFYRYSGSMLPYRKPAGDLLASAAVALLRDSTRAS